MGGRFIRKIIRSISLLYFLSISEGVVVAFYHGSSKDTPKWLKAILDPIINMLERMFA